MCDVVSMGLKIAGTAVAMKGKLDEAAGIARGLQVQRHVYGLQAADAAFNTSLLRSQAELAREGKVVADLASEVEDGAADLALARGRLSARKIGTEGRHVISGMRETFASRLVDPTHGSPVLALARTATLVENDIRLTEAGSALEFAERKVAAAKARQGGVDAIAKATNYEIGALGQVNAGLTARFNSQGALIKEHNAITAGRYGAATAFLSGASQIYSDIGGYKGISKAASTLMGGFG